VSISAMGVSEDGGGSWGHWSHLCIDLGFGLRYCAAARGELALRKSWAVAGCVGERASPDALAASTALRGHYGLTKRPASA
jgi:hypothetical protein